MNAEASLDRLVDRVAAAELERRRAEFVERCVGLGSEEEAREVLDAFFDEVLEAVEAQLRGAIWRAQLGSR